MEGTFRCGRFVPGVIFPGVNEGRDMKKIAFALAAIGALSGIAVAGETVWNWGTVSDEYSSDPGFADSKAICRKLGAPVIPATDRPGAADAAALKGCNSEALYYGEDRPPDYIKARQCAILEDGTDDEGFFGGKTILMEVYANGLGVQKNLDLATALACSVEGAPMENDGRVRHLQDLKTAPDHFDVCDDVTSGYASGWCAQRESTLAAGERDKKMAAVVQRLPAGSRPSFPALQTAFDAFVRARTDGEVDLSGTMRDVFITDTEDGERNQFLTDLTRLADGKWLGADHTAAVAADAALNKSYQKAMACAKTGGLGTVEPDGIRAAERAWIGYRDAYVRFAAPAVSQDAVLARLTNLRTAELDDLSCE